MLTEHCRLCVTTPRTYMEYVCCTSGRSKIQSAGHSILALHPLPVHEAAASLSRIPWLSRHGQDSDAIRPQLIAVLATHDAELWVSLGSCVFCGDQVQPVLQRDHPLLSG